MNLQNIFNEIEKADPEVYERLDGRRSAVKSLASFTGKVALSAAPIAFGSLFKKAYGQSVSPQIIEVLNFALTLEYLEAEYYARGLAAPGLIPVGPGRAAIETIGRHEAEHVSFLMTTISSLGGMPVKKPAFDFTAHGTFPDVFTNYELFLAGAQVFEDTGVRAYKGQAGNVMSNGTVLQAALQIHSVEARHAAHIRYMRARTSSGLVDGTVKSWITGNKSGINTGNAAVNAAINKSYAGEELTTQAGVNIAGFVSGDSASESFDEPLTKAQVLDIVSLFIVP